MLRRFAWVGLSAWAAVITVGCGEDVGEPKDKSGFAEPDSPAGGELPSFAAEQHTPGFFRNVSRVLTAQGSVGDQEAVDRLLQDLPGRIERRDETPAMLLESERSIDALLLLALRSVQANADRPGLGRFVGEDLLERVLQLDPAREAYNAANPSLPPVPASSGGPRFIAESALSALELSARQSATECQPLTIDHRAAFSPHEAQLVWIAERCQPDRWVGGYCEPDRYIEGECVDEWVPEDCDGGYYEDRGRYEYFCYSSDDCRYVWRPRQQWVPESCTGGYYEEYCYADRYEPGLCYDGTFVPGWCIEGRWEYRFPGGTWSWPRYAVSGDEVPCDALWPTQSSIALAGLGALVAELPDFVEPYWLAAAETALSSHEGEDPRAIVDAAVQILEGIRDSEWTPEDGEAVEVNP
ncbi:MAG: hypothetical protein AAFQ82_14670 [Myxococcota bacterium]